MIAESFNATSGNGGATQFEEGAVRETLFTILGRSIGQQL